jgi:hypothetical protein
MKFPNSASSREHKAVADPIFEPSEALAIAPPMDIAIGNREIIATMSAAAKADRAQSVDSAGQLRRRLRGRIVAGEQVSTYRGVQSFDAALRALRR